jgi:serine/threonine-protein kinase
MGEVWRATDVVLGRTVAVKVLLPALLTDAAFLARFKAEARILAAFRHPNVVDVYDFGESELDGRTAAYLVMAYVDGEPLSHRIATDGRLPVVDTLSVVAQAADALAAAHVGGVVHRDVKPGNLLVQADGTVVLVDFGVARSADITAITAANAVPGTVLYMAPEQVSGKPVAPTTDIYALGAVGYQCLAGVPPFNGEAPMEIALRHLNDEVPPLPDDTPEPVRTLVMRSLEKDPADRYQSAAEFAVAARAAAAAVGGTVPGAVSTTQVAPVAPVGQASVGTPARTAVDLPPVPAGGGFAPGRARTGGPESDGLGGRRTETMPAGLDDSTGGLRGAGVAGAAAVGAGAGVAGARLAGRAAPVSGGGVPVSGGAPPVGPAGGPGGPRKRMAALAGAAALVLAGAALAAVVAFTSDDTPTNTPETTTPTVSTNPTQPTQTTTGRPTSTGTRGTTPTNPATSAPAAENPGTTDPTTQPPQASDPPTNEPDPGGTGGSPGTGGGNTGGGNTGGEGAGSGDGSDDGTEVGTDG